MSRAPRRQFLVEVGALLAAPPPRLDIPPVVRMRAERLVEQRSAA